VDFNRAISTGCSFPKGPHLHQQVISGDCFGKVNIGGKTICRVSFIGNPPSSLVVTIVEKLDLVVTPEELARDNQRN
jgi:hypothetical protein